MNNKKFPSRADILKSVKGQAVGTKTQREKSMSERFASLTKKIDQLKKRNTRAQDVVCKINNKLSAAMEELVEVCPHRTITIATHGWPEDLQNNPLYRWCKVCGAYLGPATSK
jgi:DNA helicase IV